MVLPIPPGWVPHPYWTDLYWLPDTPVIAPLPRSELELREIMRVFKCGRQEAKVWRFNGRTYAIGLGAAKFAKMKLKGDR